MHPEARKELRVRLKLIVLEYAKHFSVTETCREFNVPRSTFYDWKKRYDSEGRSGLYRKKPVARSHPRKTSPEVVEKILDLRRGYQIGALRIKYYLDRYHGITISESTVTRVLRAHGVGRLPRTAPKRALHSKRYAKKVPGHHVQLDVKFLRLNDKAGKAVKRYQLVFRHFVPVTSREQPHAAARSAAQKRLSQLGERNRGYVECRSSC